MTMKSRGAALWLLLGLNRPFFLLSLTNNPLSLLFRVFLSSCGWHVHWSFWLFCFSLCSQDKCIFTQTIFSNNKPNTSRKVWVFVFQCRHVTKWFSVCIWRCSQKDSLTHVCVCVQVCVLAGWSVGMRWGISVVFLMFVIKYYHRGPGPNPRHSSSGSYSALFLSSSSSSSTPSNNNETEPTHQQV